MKLYNSKLDKRIGIGKMIGFISGLIGLIALPFVFPEVSTMLKIALFLWYTTLGVLIGVFGVWNTIPVFNVKVSYWFRGLWIGAWMNLLLALLIYDQLVVLMSNSSVDGWSPFWIVLEGAIFGLIVDFILTKYIGEGKELMK